MANKHELVQQRSAAPTRKVTFAAVVGVIATVLLSVCDAVGTFDLPTYWDTIITFVSTVAAGYLAKSKRSDV